MLTSQARESLRHVETVIVDEVHAVAGTKRGAHLGLSLERLDALLAEPAQRIGLSATVRPLEEVARFLGGTTPVEIVAPPSVKQWDLKVVVPVEDMTAPAPYDDSDEAEGDGREATSIWPHVENHVADLIEQHRSTIVFANSRRLAERLTARLNEIAAERAGGSGPTTLTARTVGPPAQVMAQSGASYGAAPVIAKAHHGSVSKEQRALIEDDLKRGRLPCVVATSSLELGIDMGAVDLVIQIESPPSVASALQRVGRAGHQVGEVSRGVLFPKHRGDLAQTAVAVERMRAGLIESMRIPTNPLDVLAQQVVSMVAMEAWSVDDVFDLVRRSASYTQLPRGAFDATLDLLSGRYPSDEFAELRPRIVWDRVTGQLTGRPGAQRLAVTSGGTIPDRGLFGVFLVSGGQREPGPGRGSASSTRRWSTSPGSATSSRSAPPAGGSRTSPTTASWSRPLPAYPGGCRSGRATPSVGRPSWARRSAPSRASSGASSRESAVAAAEERGLDPWAAGNLVGYVHEQVEATGVLPSDRTLVVEKFRDELGDWRLVVHSPYGTPVHAPWALAINARLRERYGIDGQAIASDDGIVIRIPDTDAEPPTGEVIAFEPDEIEDLVTQEVGGSALFASRFRECAARALLLPRRDPGRRSPLWQQRQRSAALLEVASKYPSFPIVLEAVRECLQDVYDLPALVGLMRRVQRREVGIHDVDTHQPSPYARSLLFGYVAQFVYEGDSPIAERRAAALALDQGLLAELLGRAELRELLDPDVLAEIEATLQRTDPERRARDAEGVADLLRWLGPVTTDEVAARTVDGGAAAEWLAALADARRAVPVRMAGEERWAAIEDVGRLRDGLGVPVPPGVPDAFTEPVDDPLADLVSRFARTHGPFTVADVSTPARARAPRSLARPCSVSVGRGGCSRASSDRPGSGAEWCDAEVLRMLRRRSLARLRQEVEPVEPAAMGRFLLAWQHVNRPQRGRPRGVDGLLQVVDQLAGYAAPASAWESLILPARLPDYEPALLDELTASGEVTWVGHAALPGTDGWVSLHLGDQAPLTLPLPEPGPRAGVGRGPPGRPRRARPGRGVVLPAAGHGDRRHRAGPGRRPLGPGLGRPGHQRHLRARCVPSPPAPAPTAPGRAAPRARPSRPSRAGLRPAPPATSGPLGAAARGRHRPDPPRPRHRRADARATRRRHPRARWCPSAPPVASRPSTRCCRRSRTPGGAGAATSSRASGRPSSAPPGRSTGSAPSPTRRGDSRASSKPEAVTLAATDPANPFGAALPWPDREASGGHRPGRKAGALVVLVDGCLTLYVERGGKTLLTWSDDADPPRPGGPVALRGRASRCAGPADGREGRRRADPRRRLDAPAGGARRGRLRLDAARAEAAWLTVPEGDTVWRAARLLDRALSGHAADRHRLPGAGLRDLGPLRRDGQRDRLARQAPAHPDRRRRPRGRSTPTSRWRAAGGCSSPGGAGPGRPTPPGWC